MPKVSIITPAYADISQKVDWLNEAIQSVVSQTMIDWEMIIIDDPMAKKEKTFDEKMAEWERAYELDDK